MSYALETIYIMCPHRAWANMFSESSLFYWDGKWIKNDTGKNVEKCKYTKRKIGWDGGKRVNEWEGVNQKKDKKIMYGFFFLQMWRIMSVSVYTLKEGQNNSWPFFVYLTTSCNHSQRIWTSTISCINALTLCTAKGRYGKADWIYTKCHLMVCSPMFKFPMTFLKTAGVMSSAPYVQALSGQASLIVAVVVPCGPVMEIFLPQYLLLPFTFPYCLWF